MEFQFVTPIVGHEPSLWWMIPEDAEIIAKVLNDVSNADWLDLSLIHI